MTETAPKKLVLSLIKGMNESKTRVQSINGELGAEIKDAAENKNINPGALKLVARLTRMNGDKSADFLSAFDGYVEYAMQAGLFGDRHVSDLVDQAEGDPGFEPAVTNVRNLRSGIRKTEEAEAPADVA